MATRFDHLTLSAYVDGELDRRTMREVERHLDSDPQARQFVLDAMHAQVLLRTGGNEAVREPVPERLRKIFERPTVPVFNWRGVPFPALKMAAAFTRAISESLEHHMSGKPLSMALGPRGQRIVVTPIKTYRNPEGLYYRGYDMGLITVAGHRKFRGMAYRTGHAEWRTTALYQPKI